MSSSGKAGAKDLRQSFLRAAADEDAIDFAFDAKDPNVTKWIREHTADTVTGISETTRTTIRDLVEASFEEPYDVRDLADEISAVVGDEDRAETIARTETMLASNQGQQLMWEQAKDEGLLTGSEEKEWIVTPDDRLCPVCEPLDGQKVALNARFDTELGAVDNPPAHPRCRCTVGLSVG